MVSFAQEIHEGTFPMLEFLTGNMDNIKLQQGNVSEQLDPVKGWKFPSGIPTRLSFMPMEN